MVTVRQVEAGVTEPRRATLVVLSQAFERAGVEFIDEAAPAYACASASRRRGQNNPKGGAAKTDLGFCEMKPISIASTLPRTTRSRWLLIRSSSIVMTLPNGVGVVSLMAAPFSLSWLRLATSSSARFGAASPTQFCERFCTLSLPFSLMRKLTFTAYEFA